MTAVAVVAGIAGSIPVRANPAVAVSRSGPTTQVAEIPIPLAATADGASGSGSGGSESGSSGTGSASLSARVPLTNAGQLVGIAWDGAGDAEFSLRSRNRAGWSGWVDVDGAPDEAPDAPEGSRRPAAGPVWVGNGTSEVEIRVTRGTPANLRLESVRVDGEPSGATVSRGAAAPAPSGATAPVYIPRSAWGAAPWQYSTPGCEDGPKIAAPRYAIVHHTATTNVYTEAEAFTQILAIQSFHINVNGWCDIAYNALVDRFGRIFEGRAGGLDKGIIGGHAKGFNTASIGVALLGQTQPGVAPDYAPVPSVSVAAIQSLLVWKFALHGIDARRQIDVVSLCEPASVCKWPAGTHVTLPTIIGHQDVGLTTCPGSSAYATLASLRLGVAAQVIRSGPWYPLPGWTPADSGPSVLTLDAWGGMHPAGQAPAASGGGYFPIPAARGITGTSTGGYVLDGWGGVHRFGTAVPAVNFAYFPGWDIMRGLVASPSTPGSGYVLSAWGSIHPFGQAPPLAVSAYWPGWDIARGIVLFPDGSGGYVLSGWGSLHPFGSAPGVTDGPYWKGWDIARAVALNPDGPGGYVLSGWGSIHPFGGAPPLQVSRYTPGIDSARGLVVLPNQRGYVIDSAGLLWPIGTTAFVPQQLTWTGYDFARGLVAT